jgi:choline kinase
VKALILAAGSAQRLRPLTDDRPKCLLDVAGRTILDRALDHLVGAGIDEVGFVTGYLEPQIERHVAAAFPGLRTRFLSNPDYATTNNAYSLWLARSFAAGAPFVLLDSDIVFEREVLTLLTTSPHADCLALRPAADLGVEEMKCAVDPAGLVRRISKEIPPASAAGESIGIEKFSAATSARLFSILEERIVARGKRDEYYEAAFQQLIDEGLALHALPVGARYCQEIDTPADLQAVRLRLAGSP